MLKAPNGAQQAVQVCGDLRDHAGLSP